MLLHGFPDSHKLWTHVTPYLVRAGYQVIAFDQRGYGETDAPADCSAYTISNICDDAIAILKHRGYTSKVKLVGHDWGALIGWSLCIEHPEFFEKYVAVSVGHPLAFRRAGWQQKLKSWYVIAFQFPGLAERMLSANNWKALRKMAGTPAEKEERIAQLSRKGRLTAGLNWYRANFKKMFAQLPKRCKVPTLGVYSTDDVALTEKQMTDSALYMDAEWRYVRIENSSHWIPIDQPEELATNICRWFNNS